MATTSDERKIRRLEYRNRALGKELDSLQGRIEKMSSELELERKKSRDPNHRYEIEILQDEVDAGRWPKHH